MLSFVILCLMFTIKMKLWCVTLIFQDNSIVNRAWRLLCMYTICMFETKAHSNRLIFWRNWKSFGIDCYRALPVQLQFVSVNELTLESLWLNDWSASNITIVLNLVIKTRCILIIKKMSKTGMILLASICADLVRFITDYRSTFI